MWCSGVARVLLRCCTHPVGALLPPHPDSAHVRIGTLAPFPHASHQVRVEEETATKHLTKTVGKGVRSKRVYPSHIYVISVAVINDPPLAAYYDPLI